MCGTMTIRLQIGGTVRKERIMQFRVEDRLGDAIDQHAAAAQMNASEFIRTVLRQALHVPMIDERNAEPRPTYESEPA